MPSRACFFAYASSFCFLSAVFSSCTQASQVLNTLSRVRLDKKTRRYLRCDVHGLRRILEDIRLDLFSVRVFNASSSKQGLRSNEEFPSFSFPRAISMDVDRTHPALDDDSGYSTGAAHSRLSVRKEMRMSFIRWDGVASITSRVELLIRSYLYGKKCERRSYAVME